MKKFFKFIFIYIPILIVVVLIALFFLITSNFGLTKVVIPIASKAVGMPIEVSSAKLHLIHPYVEINNLEVGDKSHLFIKGEKIACSFGLSDILFNNTVKVNSLMLKNVSVDMEQNKKGKWNTPFMNETSSEPEKPEKENHSAFIKLDISNVSLENINFNMKDSKDFALSVTNFNFSSSSIKNLEDSQIKFSAKLGLISGKNVKIYSSEISSDIKINLNDEYKPQFLLLDFLVSKFNGNLNGEDFKDKNVNLSASINKDSKNTITISSIALKSSTAGKTTTNLEISGQADLSPLKAKIKANINPMGPDIINLITNVFYGIDLGHNVALTLNGDLAYEDDSLSAQGQLALLNAVIATQNKAMLGNSSVSEKINYDFSADFTKKTANVKALELITYLNDSELAKVFIKKPLFMDWSTDEIATPGSIPEVFLATEKLDLSLLDSFMEKDMKLRGELSTDMKLQLDLAHSNFDAIGKVNIANASFTKDNLKFIGLDINQDIDVSMENMRRINVKKFNLKADRKGLPLFKLLLEGDYDLSDGKGKLSLNIPSVESEMIDIFSPDFISSEQSPSIRNMISSFKPSLECKTNFELTQNSSLNINFLAASLKSSGGTLALSLNSPLMINLEGNKEVLTTDIKLNSSVKDFDLAKLNLFIPPDAGTKFDGGLFNLLASISLNKTNYDINADLQADAQNIDCVVDKLKYDKIDLDLRSSVALSDFSDLTLSKVAAKVVYDGVNALNLNGDCFLSFKNTSDLTVNTALNVNEAMLKALKMTGSDDQRIGAFRLDGTLNLKNSPVNMIVDANLDIPTLVIYNLTDPNISKDIESKIDFSMLKTEKQLTLKSASVKILDNKEPLVDIQSSGNVAFDRNYQSEIDVSSNKLDLKKVIEIYSALFGEPNKSVTTTEPETDDNAATLPPDDKEPAPLDLKNINLVSKINFNDIEYGPLIKSKINAVLSIKDNQIVLKPAKLTINDSQIDLYFYMNPSYSDGYTYEFKENLTNLNINPFLKTFIDGDYSNTKGTISELSTELKGKGFTEANLMRYLNANLILICNNISLPVEITQNRILALIVLPLKLISNIIQYLPNAQIPSNLTQASSITSRILNQKKNLNFQKGVVKLNASNGMVNVNKFDFRGGVDDMIKYILANGTIGYDSSLSLHTNTSLSGIDVPLTINGTIDNPSPDIPLFITGFLTKNAVNLLNNTNVNEILANPGQGISNVLQSGAQNILNNFMK